MANPKKKPAGKPAKKKEDVKEIVLASLKEGGFTKAEIKALKSGAITAKKLGDGVLAGKLFAFLEKLIPKLLPLIGLNDAAASAADDGEDEYLAEFRDAAARQGLTDNELESVATGGGWGAMFAKYLAYAQELLPIIGRIIDNDDE